MVYGRISDKVITLRYFVFERYDELTIMRGVKDNKEEVYSMVTEIVNNTHANKSASYDLGRPDYPYEFFDYLYSEFGLKSDSVIADVGAGTGKITEKFLEKGNTVYAVEPDKEMMGILKVKLAQFINCIPIESVAENTGISSKSVDLIFCGNSYEWFNRSEVIPEFQRIIRDYKSQNIVIARLSPEKNIYQTEFLEINNRFSKSVLGRIPDNSSPFQNDVYVSKEFDYVIHQEFNKFLHGCLSASYAPGPEDNCFKEYCLSLKRLFDRYSENSKLEGRFKLLCLIGRVESLTKK